MPHTDSVTIPSPGQPVWSVRRKAGAQLGGQKVDGFGVMKSDLSRAVICPLSVQLCGAPVTDIAVSSLSIIHDHDQLC